MADEEGPSVAPRVAEYDPITGVPSEFNEFLPQDSTEYKRWKASQEGSEAMEKLTLKDKDGNEIEKRLPGGKVKKKQAKQVIIKTETRNKKKCITTVSGLDAFGIKLSDASKLFGKKFACGASVVKDASQKEQIDMQGEYLHELPELILKNYATSNGVSKKDIFLIGEDKKKVCYDDDDDDDGSGDD